MTLRHAALAAAALALATPIAASDHPATTVGHGGVCPPYSQYYPDRTTGPIYVALDETVSDFLFSMWIYRESNGVPALQRHDDYCYDAGFNSNDLSDTIIF